MTIHTFDEYIREQRECSGCGELIEKHVVKNLARYHVLSYFGGGTAPAGKECNEPMCEINHKCKERA